MSTSNSPSNYNAITKYGAWIILAVALTGAAQFDTTAQLAAAFAYLGGRNLPDPDERRRADRWLVTKRRPVACFRRVAGS